MKGFFFLKSKMQSTLKKKKAISNFKKYNFSGTEREEKKRLPREYVLR